MQRRSFITAGFIALCATLKPAFAYGKDFIAYACSVANQEEPVIKIIPLTYDDDTFGRIEYFTRVDGKQEMLLFVNDNLISRTIIDPKDHNEATTIVCHGKSPVRTDDLNRVLGQWC